MIYLEKECYQALKKREKYLDFFEITFLEFDKKNAKICQRKLDDIQRLCDMFHQSVHRKSKTKTNEELISLQKQVYPILINLLYENINQYICTQETEYVKALIPDWRNGINTSNKSCFGVKATSSQTLSEPAQFSWYTPLIIYLKKTS